MALKYEKPAPVTGRPGDFLMIVMPSGTVGEVYESDLSERLNIYHPDFGKMPNATHYLDAALSSLGDARKEIIENFSKVLRGDVHQFIEHFDLLVGGVPTHIHVSAQKGNRSTVLILRDETQLTLQKRELERRSREHSAFVGRFAAEVTDFFEGIKRRFYPLSDKCYALSVVEGDQPMERKIVEMESDVIDPVLEDVSRDAAKRKVSIDHASSAEGSTNVNVDPKLFRFVYATLFGNAIVHGERRRGKIAYGAADFGKDYRFNVWRSGPEIPEEMIGRIFEKFVRVEESGEPGSGTSLYMSREIVRKHGGEMSARNTGDGVDMNFTLPKP